MSRRHVGADPGVASSISCVQSDVPSGTSVSGLVTDWLLGVVTHGS